MLSEALDITIESRKDAVWLVLSGPFHSEQIPNIRDRIEGLVGDGNRHIVIDLEGVSEVAGGVSAMFLGVLNLIRGKKGDLKLIFRNSVVSESFSPYRNLFTIYPDRKSFESGGLLSNMRRQGMLLTRKTGIRLSRPVAIFLLFVVCGWFLSLAFIIRMQSRLLSAQEAEILVLQRWQENTGIEIEHLRSRIRPLEQLGLLHDSLPE